MFCEYEMKNCVVLPAAGWRAQFFHLIFMQPMGSTISGPSTVIELSCNIVTTICSAVLSPVLYWNAILLHRMSYHHDRVVRRHIKWPWDKTSCSIISPSDSCYIRNRGERERYMAFRASGHTHPAWHTGTLTLGLFIYLFGNRDCCATEVQSKVLLHLFSKNSWELEGFLQQQTHKILVRSWHTFVILHTNAPLYRQLAYLGIRIKNSRAAWLSYEAFGEMVLRKQMRIGSPLVWRKSAKREMKDPFTRMARVRGRSVHPPFLPRYSKCVGAVSLLASPRQ